MCSGERPFCLKLSQLSWGIWEDKCLPWQYRVPIAKRGMVKVTCQRSAIRWNSSRHPFGPHTHTSRDTLNPIHFVTVGICHKQAQRYQSGNVKVFVAWFDWNPTICLPLTPPVGHHHHCWCEGHDKGFSFPKSSSTGGNSSEEYFRQQRFMILAPDLLFTAGVHLLMPKSIKRDRDGIQWVHDPETAAPIQR